MSECCVGWCNAEVVNKKRGMCHRHALQFNRFGRNFRTNRDPNIIKVYEDHAVLELEDCRHNKVADVLIDLDDVDFVSRHRWNLNAMGYPCCTDKGLLHTMLMKPPKGFMSDHINRDRTDNRRSNLRVVTVTQNNQNTGVNSANTTGYKGVQFRKDTKRYSARIVSNGIGYALGCYDTAEEAAEVYNSKALELNGEFAYLNEISYE